MLAPVDQDAVPAPHRSPRELQLACFSATRPPLAFPLVTPLQPFFSSLRSGTFNPHIPQHPFPLPIYTAVHSSIRTQSPARSCLVLLHPHRCFDATSVVAVACACIGILLSPSQCSLISCLAASSPLLRGNFGCRRCMCLDQHHSLSSYRTYLPLCFACLLTPSKTDTALLDQANNTSINATKPINSVTVKQSRHHRYHQLRQARCLPTLSTSPVSGSRALIRSQNSPSSPTLVVDTTARRLPLGSPRRHHHDAPSRGRFLPLGQLRQHHGVLSPCRSFHTGSLRRQANGLSLCRLLGLGQLRQHPDAPPVAR